MNGKKLLGWALVAAVAAAVWARYAPLDSGTAPGREQGAKAEARGQPSVAEGSLAPLPAREAVGGMDEVFAPRTWGAPPPRRPPPVAEPAAAAVVQPTPPPMPYRVAGKVVRDGASQVVLAKGERVLTVREGDMLEDGYRVDSVDADGVTLVYLPLGVRERVPVASTLGVDTPRSESAASGPTARPSPR